ncbi:hypothetical protein [Emticicia sp. TH156]|uniref:hypothetical protein n=1 Tax=Emticicia sp. TH156 TaxID=2067454 RepID=UPI00156DDEA9|nr:hypothetical protein [Emticicia sp. TH156]
MTLKGYSTLSANSIIKGYFPEYLQKKWPPGYQYIPTVLLGRLAVDISIKGKGYGEILLIDALKRCFDISGTSGTLAILVDPIDDIARNF